MLDALTTEQEEESNADNAKNIHQRRTDRGCRNRAQIGSKEALRGITETRNFPALGIEGLDHTIAGNGLMQNVLDFRELVLAMPSRVANAGADLSRRIDNK